MSGSVADQVIVRIDVGLVGNVSAVTTPVDFHHILRSEFMHTARAGSSPRPVDRRGYRRSTADKPARAHGRYRIGAMIEVRTRRLTDGRPPSFCEVPHARPSARNDNIMFRAIPGPRKPTR